MAIMTTAPQEQCGHEACDMEPCTWESRLYRYERDDVWGWGTTCERCEGFFPGSLPEGHHEVHHNDF